MLVAMVTILVHKITTCTNLLQIAVTESLLAISCVFLSIG
jgi:hypothetical protein